MLINLTDVLSCDGKVVKRTVETELKSFDTDLGHFPLSEEEPLALTLTNLGKDKLLIEGSTKLKTVIPCDRCLKPVEHSFDMICEEECVLPQHASEDSYVDGMFLDTDRMITHEILLQWPSKNLCRPDCKGLCSVCGHDLNVSECGCNRVVPDPRMAAIQDLFQTFQQESEKS